MDCSDCVTVLEHAVGRLDGVLTVSVNYAAQRMFVEFDSQKANRAAIESRIRSVGYAIPAEGLPSWFREQRELLFSLAAGLLLLVGWAGGRFLGLPQPISLALYIGAYILTGWDIARHAFHALRQRHFDTDLLMLIR